MVTKAEIKTIDFTSNTCIVRIPFFETACKGEKAILTATISNPPGVYNGYKEGDIVWVAFEDGQAQQPCVIGKLFLGTNAENQSARGVVNCESLSSSSNNSLPLSTKIESDTIADKITVEGTATTYKTLKDVLDTLKANTNKLENISSGTVSAITGFQTILCNNLCRNLISTTDIDDYSIIDSGKTIAGWPYFYLQYRNNKVLDVNIAQKYMQYITGINKLPAELNSATYTGAFMTRELQIYYPVWDSINNYLMLLIIQGETIEAKIRRIIEEYLTGTGEVIDLSTGEKYGFNGAKSLNTETGEVEADSYEINEIKDLSGEE